MTPKFWSVGAFLLAGLHAVFVAFPLVASGGRGESQAFLVALADLPLVWLLERVPGGGYILYTNTLAYVIFFSLAGTLMYAGIGAALGALLGRLVRAMRERRRNE